MAALLVVAIDRPMSPPRALPCEKIYPFYFVPLFLIHDASRFTEGKGYLDIKRGFSP